MARDVLPQPPFFHFTGVPPFASLRSRSRQAESLSLRSAPLKKRKTCGLSFVADSSSQCRPFLLSSLHFSFASFGTDFSLPPVFGWCPRVERQATVGHATKKNSAFVSPQGSVDSSVTGVCRPSCLGHYGDEEHPATSCAKDLIPLDHDGTERRVSLLFLL